MNRIGIISTLIASLISGCGTVEEQKTTVNNRRSTRILHSDDGFGKSNKRKYPSIDKGWSRR